MGLRKERQPGCGADLFHPLVCAQQVKETDMDTIVSKVSQWYLTNKECYSEFQWRVLYFKISLPQLTMLSLFTVLIFIYILVSHVLRFRIVASAQS